MESVLCVCVCVCALCECEGEKSVAVYQRFLGLFLGLLFSKGVMGFGPLKKEKIFIVSGDKSISVRNRNLENVSNEKELVTFSAYSVIVYKLVYLHIDNFLISP